MGIVKSKDCVDRWSSSVVSYDVSSETQRNRIMNRPIRTLSIVLMLAIPTYMVALLIVRFA